MSSLGVLYFYWKVNDDIVRNCQKLKARRIIQLWDNRNDDMRHNFHRDWKQSFEIPSELDQTSKRFPPLSITQAGLRFKLLYLRPFVGALALRFPKCQQFAVDRRRGIENDYHRHDDNLVAYEILANEERFEVKPRDSKDQVTGIGQRSAKVRGSEFSIVLGARDDGD